MDPDALLNEIRACYTELNGSIKPERIELGDRLGDLIADLDEWITNGGFLPKAWSRTK
jgi:hypothetical protein